MQKRAYWLPFATALAFAGWGHGQTGLIASPPSIALTTASSETPSQLLTVTSANGGPISFLISASANFRVIPVGYSAGTIMTTPESFNVICDCLNIGAGTFSGAITLTPPASMPGVMVPIAVNIAGPPVVSAILNAASFSSGPISPGEIISIFGTGLGPPSPAGMELTARGKVSTSIGNTAVIFFNGAMAEYYAPLTYVSGTQINCIVPYEVAQWPQVFLQVGYVTGWFVPKTPNVQMASTAPGIFTAAGTGKGQAAALNSDNTPNTNSNPALAGSTVAVYITGEGQTSPAGVTGSVTCSGGCATTDQIPKPLSPVTASVGGQSATVAFYGEAPGLVAGVMQVNVVIPPDTPSGLASLSIAVGSNTQAGVTVAVK